MVFLVTGSALALLYVFILLAAGRRYAALIKPLEDGQHFFKPLYPVGFYLLDKLKYKFSLAIDKKRFKECKVVFGERFSEYYFRVNYAAKIGVALFVVPFIFLAYPIFKAPVIILFGLIIMVTAYWNYDMKITDVIKAREKEIAKAFPEVLTKLTLLVNAGMVMNEAWEKISLTADTTFYKEMQTVRTDMQNGISEIDALLAFGDRCFNGDVKKFVSTLVQNISKGNRELVEYLKDQTKMSWEERKHTARQEGEKASSKLMLPIGLMFMGVLVLILVPIFANLSF